MTKHIYHGDILFTLSHKDNVYLSFLCHRLHIVSILHINYILQLYVVFATYNQIVTGGDCWPSVHGS